MKKVVINGVNYEVIRNEHLRITGFPGGSVVKNLPANSGDVS